MTEKEYHELKKLFFLKCRELEEISSLVLEYERNKNNQTEQTSQTGQIKEIDTDEEQKIQEKDESSGD